MSTEITMPKLGLTMTSGTMVEWLKKVGDRVEEGDPLASIETEKIEQEIESPCSGTLVEILVEAGADADVGAKLGSIEED